MYRFLIIIFSTIFMCYSFDACTRSRSGSDSTSDSAPVVMGIKVEGTLSSMEEQFGDLGYTEVMTTNKGNAVSLWSERFNSVPNTPNPWIYFTPRSHLVWGVLLKFTQHDDWQSLKWDYQRLLSELIKSHGKPESTSSTFIAPYNEGDGNEMEAVSKGYCKYYASWPSIRIQIADDPDLNYPHVEVLYSNITNEKLNDEEIQQARIDSINSIPKLPPL